MNCENLLKCATPNEDLHDSTIIISGRYTSTPVGSRLLSSVDLDLNISTISTVRSEKRKIQPINLEKTELSYVHPSIEHAPEPIFGRRNLKLLSECARRNDSLRPTVNEFLKLNNQESSQCLDAPSSSYVSDREALLSKFKATIASKASDGSRKIPVEQSKKIQQIGKRRSIQNKSQKPMLKVTPKGPKSPRLLTALRAKQRKARKSTDVRSVEGKASKKSCKDAVSERGNPISTPKISLKKLNKYSITIPESPKLGKRRFSFKQKC